MVEGGFSCALDLVKYIRWVWRGRGARSCREGLLVGLCCDWPQCLAFLTTCWLQDPGLAAVAMWPVLLHKVLFIPCAFAPATFPTPHTSCYCCYCCWCYCRAQYGDYFGIGVAGYPEAHPDSIVEDPEAMKKAYWENLAYLKEKVRTTPEGSCQSHTLPAGLSHSRDLVVG